MINHNDYFMDPQVVTVSDTRDECESILYQTQKVEIYDKVQLRTVQGQDVFVAVTTVSFEGHLIDANLANIPTDLDNMYPKGAVNN